MNSEIISALISLAGVIVSALVSMRVSKAETAREFERLKLSWAREDRLALEKDFAEMTAIVSAYIANDSPENRGKAMASVASVMSRESGEMAYRLQILYARIFGNNKTEAEMQLLDVIENNRQERSP